MIILTTPFTALPRTPLFQPSTCLTHWRAAMTDKRQWTEGSLKAEFVFDTWYVINTHDNCPIAEAITCNAEADARLFAAAPAMYEALDWLMKADVDDAEEACNAARAALHAANPSAFNPDGQASEPGGESK